MWPILTLKQKNSLNICPLTLSWLRMAHNITFFLTFFFIFLFQKGIKSNLFLTPNPCTMARRHHVLFKTREHRYSLQHSKNSERCEESFYIFWRSIEVTHDYLTASLFSLHLFLFFALSFFLISDYLISAGSGFHITLAGEFSELCLVLGICINCIIFSPWLWPGHYDIAPFF